MKASFQKQLWRKNWAQVGQTAVEYILILALSAFLASAVFGKLKGYIVTNPDSILNTYLDGFNEMFGGDNGGLRLKYKRFTIRK